MDEHSERKTDYQEPSKIDFMQEVIKERPINKKKLLRRSLITAGLAVLFGLIACVTFLLLEPVITKVIYPEQQPEIITFPEEEEELNPEDMLVEDTALNITNQVPGNVEETEMAVEDEAAEDHTQAAEPVPDTAPAETTVKTEAETTHTRLGELTPETGIESVQKMYGSLSQLSAEVKRSIVTVTSLKEDKNWINEVYQDKGISSGLIIADNGLELLILANYDKKQLSDGESLIITFCDGEQREAQLKEQDSTTGLAVLSIPLSQISRKMKTEIRYAALGSSLGKALVGQPIIALGSPAGLADSISYGIVTSQGTTIGLTDTNYKLLTTDIYGSKSASGVLINMNGQVIGIISNLKSGQDMENQLCAIGISELKKVVERMSNGEQVPYLGIHGTEISTLITPEAELPAGAYITAIDLESSAMKAGVQSGDIITGINDNAIVSFADYVNVIMHSKIGDTLRFTVMRQGQGSYQEMALELVVGAQE